MEYKGYFIDKEGNKFLPESGDDPEIIEYQDGENGHIKFADGLQFCWKSMMINAGGTKWTDAIYYSDHNLGDWTSEFSTLRGVSATVKATTFWCSIAESSDTSAGKIRCFRPNNGKADVRVYILGWGKWK